MRKTTKAKSMIFVACPENGMQPTPANACVKDDTYRYTKCGSVGHAKSWKE